MLNLCLAIIWLFLTALRIAVLSTFHGKDKTIQYNIFASIIWTAIPVYLIVNAYILEA